MSPLEATSLLAAYNEQVRRSPPARPGGERVEQDEHVTRIVGDDWSGVIWSDLTEANADRVIAEEIDRFARHGRRWEWKHFSYDQPADLPARLVAAGFRAEDEETLLVAEIADLELGAPPPEGIVIRVVSDANDIELLVRAEQDAFGTDGDSSVGRALAAALEQDPPAAAGLLALAGGAPVAAARVAFERPTEFAMLLGGGTLPGWRRRGIYRALVARRAALAAAAGFRYLQTDSSPESRPILARLGFVELATTTPYVNPAVS